ncbi:MAG TPA: 2Fe-2S iron-sulfur cluster-binding protein, partial [Chloroflexota bacterium]|nr:2Fe-2S iron-sulfur cluster-binding protein [Chloroflexota bacterium]
MNGVGHTVPAGAERSLLSVLRDDLDLTGTKYGCGEAQCGACIVLIDGQPFPACVTPARAAAGRAVLTIEGLAPASAAPEAEGGDGPAASGALHPVQRAFVEEVAMQCGYCTPGMVMTAVALLRQNPHPSEAEIV